MSEPRAANMTFSEERLKQLFAEFKLELLTEFAKKASLEAHELLDHRVRVLELWQAGEIATQGTRREISARQLVLFGIAATVFAALLAAVVTLVWLWLGG